MGTRDLFATLITQNKRTAGFGGRSLRAAKLRGHTNPLPLPGQIRHCGVTDVISTSPAISRGAQLSNATQPSVQIIAHGLIVVLVDLLNLHIIKTTGSIVEPADGRKHVTHCGQGVAVQP